MPLSPRCSRHEAGRIPFCRTGGVSGGVALFHHIDAGLQPSFRQEFRALIALIRSNPLLFNLRKHRVRRANLQRFGLYYIAYMLWRDEIIIIAVGHASRRPYYWRRRPKGYRDAH